MLKRDKLQTIVGNCIKIGQVAGN